MENRNKICPRCGYVTDPDFVFCAKCGTPLVQPVVDQPQNPNPQATPFQPTSLEPVFQQKVIDEKDVYRYNYDGDVIAYESTLNGLPTAEVSDYIGKNRHRFLTKFFKQSFGAKGGWNWMVFLFGMLGVPFVWFFYRKMKKQGIIALILSLSLTLCMAVSYGVAFRAVGDEAVQYCETIAELNDKYGYYDEYDYNIPVPAIGDNLNSKYTAECDKALDDFEKATQENKTFAAMVMITQAISYLNLALTITLAIFADRWYYKKAMADLNELNRYNTPNHETVMATGGVKTSAGVLSGILGGLGQVVLTALVVVPFVLPIFHSLIDIILK